MNRNKAYWLCQFGGWGLYFIASTPLAMLQDDFHPAIPLFTLTMMGFAILATHLYRQYIKRHGWVDLPPIKLIPRAVAGVLVMTTICSVLAMGVSRIAHFFIQKDAFNWQLVVFSFFGWGILLLAWSLFYFGIHFFWNYRKAEISNWKLKADFREAELRALKAQVNPHYIFNMLNNLRGLIAEDPARAQAVVTRMAKLLRATSLSEKDMLVPLETELAIAENYLELEAVRLEERLRYRLDVPTDMLSVPVPAMLLQTLVENGIKHGISRLPAGGDITVTAHWEPQTGDPRALCLRVRNTGKLRSAEAALADDGADRHGGIGLCNARERLRLHYGPAAQLALDDTDDGHVLAQVKLPLEVNRENLDRG